MDSAGLYFLDVHPVNKILEKNSFLGSKHVSLYAKQLQTTLLTDKSWSLPGEFWNAAMFVMPRRGSVNIRPKYTEGSGPRAPIIEQQRTDFWRSPILLARTYRHQQFAECSDAEEEAIGGG
jgi:hypothetical protein